MAGISFGEKIELAKECGVLIMAVFLTTEAGLFLTDESGVFLTMDEVVFADVKRTFTVIPRIINFEIVQKKKRQ